MDKKLLRKIAKRIKELRKEHGYTQDDLSFKADIPRSTIGNIETAQNDVTLSKINKIAKAFNITISELLKL